MNAPAPDPGPSAGGAFSPNALLRARGIHVGYGDRPVLSGLDVDVRSGAISAVIGPNGCGKSTLLRSLGRLLPTSAGDVLLDGEPITRVPTRSVARRVAVLPQSPVAPEGMTVADLVARGRSPHQSWLRQWSREDESVVQEAMELTGVEHLAERRLDELSGGQRQRVWIAMTLAQQTEVLLLDEPTTFLDLAHAIEVLDLVERLHQQQGRTVVMVLHDLNLAARYAQHLVVMKEGSIVAQGDPAGVLTAELLREVFGLEAVVIDNPVADGVLVVPTGRVSA